MEIKNLYTLKTILEEGSFANAANRLSYTQSTITFQMRQLEEEQSDCYHTAGYAICSGKRYRGKFAS